MALTQTQWNTLAPPLFTKGDRVMTVSTLTKPDFYMLWKVKRSLSETFLEGTIPKVEVTYELEQVSDPTKTSMQPESLVQSISDAKIKAHEAVDSEWPT